MVDFEFRVIDTENVGVHPSVSRSRARILSLLKETREKLVQQEQDNQKDIALVDRYISVVSEPYR